MAKSFYETLPSNGSTGVFPDNTVTEYRNKLAKPIYFEGDWEVGMLECSYPHSWWQICHENSGFSFFNRSEATVNSETPIPWEGSRFSNIESIQNVTPTILKERLFLTYREGQDLIEFSDPLPNYDDRVGVKAEEGFLIEFRGKLCRTLGFPDPTLVADTWERAPYPWTSENIDHIFFYIHGYHHTSTRGRCRSTVTETCSRGQRFLPTPCQRDVSCDFVLPGEQEPHRDDRTSVERRNGKQNSFHLGKNDRHITFSTERRINIRGVDSLVSVSSRASKWLDRFT